MPKNLKLQNLAAILLYIAWCTALVVVFMAAPPDFWVELTKYFKEFNAKDGLILLLSPIISLVVNGILPPNAKAALVFWRTKDILPGHRAFEIHAKKDPRISVEELKKLVPEWPRKSTKQNELWYRMYRKVDDVETVRDAHRSFLLARDLCCVSVVFLFIGSIVLSIRQISSAWLLGYVGILIVQYLLFAIVARHHGNRFVRNVLAEFQTKSKSLVSA